jgi:hypothetical protein
MSLCEPDMERVEAHISGCRACGSRANEYAMVVGVVKAGRIVRMPESQASWQSLRTTLENERRFVPRQARSRFPVLALGSLAMAAMLLLFFAPELAKEFKASPGRSGPDTKNVEYPQATDPGDTSGPRHEKIVVTDPGQGSAPPSVVSPAKLVNSDPVRPHPESPHASPSVIDNKVYGTSPKPQPAAELARYVSGDQADRPFDGSPKRDYVLSPVGMGRSQGNGAHFVMGTIPQSEGGITTASYTKPVEEAPVW